MLNRLLDTKAKVTLCPICAGLGSIPRMSDDEIDSVSCLTCNGTGIITIEQKINDKNNDVK